MRYPDLFFCFLFLFSTLSGCSSKNAIERRGNGKSFYIVNPSSSKTYLYKVKETRVENDTVTTTVIREITLAPSSEQFLGYEDIELPREYPVIPKRRLKVYEMEDEAPDGRSGLSDHSSLRDTFINGDRKKYEYVTEMARDLQHPYPIRRFRYNFEVTDRKEVK